jgi:solute carrier family 35 protein F5
VILVSLSDSGDAPAAKRPSPTPSSGRPLLTGMQGREKSIIGDSLALLSALFYAVYVILLKVRIRSESRIDMQLFFGFVGLFNIIGCWPIGLLLHLTGVEKVELPSSGRVVAGLLVNVSFSIAVPCEAVASHKRFYCRWLSRSPAIISM